MKEMLFNQIENEYGCAECHKDNTRCAVEDFRLGFVCEYRGNSRPHKSERHRAAARMNQSGAPPIIKWETEPVSAVKVMMNTLVPTAVLSSYPSTLVKIRSIIIPPPAPINPR